MKYVLMISRVLIKALEPLLTLLNTLNENVTRIEHRIEISDAKALNAAQIRLAVGTRVVVGRSVSPQL